MIVIDGSQGEGGGQVLRSSLALAMVTGQPFRIEKIRAGRAKPGLLRQHLTAVQASEAVSGASVEGAVMGSTALSFTPGRITPGDYSFAVGTAGSATLVFQTVLPALMGAEGPSNLVLEGGTHNTHAPPFDFIERAFLPLLRAMGLGIAAKLHRPGYYPAGGGRFVAEITPAAELTPLTLTDRGALRSRKAVATVSRLPLVIAERELETLANNHGWAAAEMAAREERRSAGPGNVLQLFLEQENLTEVFTGFGEKRVKAQKVAAGAAEEATRYLASNAAVGPHLADQLLIPLALAGGGSFTTLAPSLHTRTNIAVIQHFLDIDISVTEAREDCVLVAVGAR